MPGLRPWSLDSSAVVPARSDSRIDEGGLVLATFDDALPVQFPELSKAIP